MEYFIETKNEIEREIIQKILFTEGYMWCFSRTKDVLYLYDQCNNIFCYDTHSKELSRRKPSDGEHYLTFNEFINRKERELNEK